MKKRKIKVERIVLIILILATVVFAIFLEQYNKNDSPENIQDLARKIGSEPVSNNGITVQLLGYSYITEEDAAEYGIDENERDAYQFINGEITNQNDLLVFCSFNVTIDGLFATSYNMTVAALDKDAFAIPTNIPYGESQIDVLFHCLKQDS